MARNRLLVYWAYLVEVLLVAGVYGLILLLSTPQKVTEFILGTADSWASMTQVLLAASVALLIMMVVNVLFRDFGDELRNRGGAAVYLWGFGTPVLIFLFTTAALRYAAWAQDWRIAHIAFLALLYSAVNALTLIKNTIDLVQLYFVYKKHIRHGSGDTHAK